ncbi:MAG: hypothetical protein HGA24_06320 [Candidatus Aminicenantes bacterium]|nr:hypothetical protein [Candidatus Aminicenantes bacterium]
MNRRSLVVLVLGVLLSSVAVSAQIRTEKPNDFSFELGGRCIIYSLNYQRMVAPAFGLEVGASYIGGGSEGESAGVFFLSGGGRFYFINKNASPYLSGGIVWASADTSAGPDAVSGVYFYASPGFELRMAGGFVFRAGVNFLFEEGFAVWPGIHLGVAF